MNILKLFELIVVIVIITTVSLISYSQLTKAQTRTKVVQALDDLNTYEVALLSYQIDYSTFPKGNNFGFAGARFSPNEQGIPTALVLERLSTPIAYMTDSFLPDPFEVTHRTGAINNTTGEFGVESNPILMSDPNFSLIELYSYHTPGPTGLQDVDNSGDSADWYFAMSSKGPFQHFYNPAGLFSTPSTTEIAILNNLYDPSNGTISIGGIWNVDGQRTGENAYGDLFFITAQKQNITFPSNSDLYLLYE